ncbi:MAG: hypothetical protein ACFFCE_19490 [Promethearchaeota archaeon]
MVQSYIPKDFSKKNNNKKSFEKWGEQSEGKKDYLNLWRVNPSFRDINRVRSLTKALSLLVLTFIFIISVYKTTYNLITSLFSGIIFLIIFILIFNKEFFSLNLLFSRLFRRMRIFDPFEPYIFWFNNGDKHTLFVHNKNDLVTFAMQIYSIEMIPENVNPNVGGFIRSLSIKDIRLSYSYQVVQKPIINLFDNNINTQETYNSSTSTIGKIYFSVFGSISGILTSKRIDKLNHFINLYSSYLKSNLVTNFHHFKSKLLSGDDLLNGVRVMFIGVDSQENKNMSAKSLKNSIKKIYLKFSFVIFLLIHTGWFFSEIIVLDLTYILLIDLSLIFLLIFTWWRSILFEISKRSLRTDTEMDFLHPFKKVKFYTLRKFPHSIFMHVDNRLLIGIKIINLKYIYNNTYHRFDPRFDHRLDRFIEALNYHKIHFTYTLKNEPLCYYTFDRYGLKSVYDKVKRNLLFHPNYRIQDALGEEQWLSYRKGMWYSFLTISINRYKLTESFEIAILEKLEHELESHSITLKGAFQSNFHNYKVEDLELNRLISGYLFSVFKHNNFRIDGSHLSYLMLQGATLIPFSTPVQILRRTTESELPVEFNTPTYLKNFITIGYTLNTEVFEKQVPVGFLYDQIKNLLIVNGIYQSRELTSMKIVSELIPLGKPSLIFDFSGQWRKLLSLFKGSPYIKDISHFRLGTAFTINPLNSDIPYDTNNTDYLEYMLDAFALAFKKDPRTIDILRDIISKNPEIDLSSMQLEAKSQNNWQKTSLSFSIETLFADLTPQDKTYFQDLYGPNKILVNDFINDEKTIIIDLSILKDLNKKLFFAFLILSKIIHYIKYEKDYHPKVIVLPFIDLFFDSRFLDTRMNYGKINSFLGPLVTKDFGLLFTANQVHYLHPNIFTYFSNIISFRATDNNDVALLKSLLSLYETPGTGEYSKSRHKTYKLEYLRALKNNNILIKREDIYQTFPALIDWKKVKNSEPYTYDQVIEFMEEQGYNLRSTEQMIINGAMTTIFEKDLGSHIFYIEEIINFMKSIKSVERVGNLYKDKIKKELLKWIYPKLLKKTSNKGYMKKIRDDLLNKLLKHDYLVEDHPKRASGSESLATSYKVGDQYEKALNDYFKIKGKNSKITVEKVSEDLTEDVSKEKEKETFTNQPRKYIIRQEDVYEALAREFSDFTYEMSKLYKFMRNTNYSSALKIEQNIIKKFLFNVFRHYYNIDRAVIPSEVLSFFETMENTENFPFTVQKLKDYLTTYQEINLDINDPEKLAHKLYNSIHHFFIKIQNYIYQE